MMLTARQKDCLDFIVTYMRERGISPSVTDVQRGILLDGRSSVHRLLQALEERGFIRRLPRRARAIEVLRTEVPVPKVAKAKRAKRSSRDITIPRCGSPPKDILRLCPTGKISAWGGR